MDAGPNRHAGALQTCGRSVLLVAVGMVRVVRHRRTPGDVSSPRDAVEGHAVSDFKVQALEQLTDQVRFSPPGVRQEQLDRARTLRGQVRPERSYPYQFVIYRITNYRSDDQPNLLIAGDDLRHDLDLFLEHVSRTLQTGLELPAEPMFSLEQVSKRLNVSTKTVSRWRKHGLIGQQVMQNGRKQL